MSSTDHDVHLVAEFQPLIQCRSNDRGLQLAMVSLCDICTEVMRLFYNVRKDQRNTLCEAQDLRKRLRTW